MSPDAPQLYGFPIAVEAAKKTATAAIGEARRNTWAMAVAVVDTAGDLVYFERMDGTQAGSIMVANTTMNNQSRPGNRMRAKA